MDDQIKNKLLDRSARIGVVGLGYVGLPFAVEKAKIGFQVTGFEQNTKKVAMINAGTNYIKDVKDGELRDLVERGLIRAVDDFASVSELDVVVICVPTPLDKNLTPDLSYVESVTRAIAPYVRRNQLISLESTTYPGTTDDVMKPILEQGSGLKAEIDFYLAHSPERVDPGNSRYTTKNTNKVVGGVGPKSLEVAKMFYEQTIDHVVPVSSAKAAELTKVFENTYRAVNIALVNELTMLCDKLGLNVWEVLDAAFTKPFGIQPFYPGPGVGGHCIPLDPHYLEWKAREYNFQTRFVALAGAINRGMPSFVREKIHRALNIVGVAPRNASLLFLGIAYKSNIDDDRESPAFEVMSLMRADGASIAYHDPYLPHTEQHGFDLDSQALTAETLARYDVVIITTDHANVEYEIVMEHAQCIVDTRNALAKRGLTGEKVILL